MAVLSKLPLPTVQENVLFKRTIYNENRGWNDADNDKNLF